MSIAVNFKLYLKILIIKLIQSYILLKMILLINAKEIREEIQMNQFKL